MTSMARSIPTRAQGRVAARVEPSGCPARVSSKARASAKTPIRPSFAGIAVGAPFGHQAKRIVAVRSGEFDAEEQQPDFISRLVVGIFGKRGKDVLDDPEPMGLKRMTSEDFPEMYPATITEFAAPVEEDGPEVQTFRPLLAKTQLETKPLMLVYSADKCGWDPDAFHRCVDSMGAAVVVARTTGGAVLGGYNPKGWIGIGEDRDAIAAFLFTWPDGDQSKPAIKLPKVGGASMAVIDKVDGGIQFGPEGLTIPLGSTGAAPKLAKSRLGSYYAKLPGGGRHLFSDSEVGKGTELTDLQVWVAKGRGEEWQLNGIVWSTNARSS